MLSLKDLRSPAAGLDWHEAVAVGAALGELLADSRAAACPRPVDITLLPSGNLRVTGAGHVDGSAAAGVAHLLGQLLEAAPYPAELRVLVEAFAADHRSCPAGVDAVTEFVSELAFFERPGRREVLSTIAQRAEPALERAQRAAALEALTERTRLAAAGGPIPAALEAAGELDDADEVREWDPPTGRRSRPADGPGCRRVDRVPRGRLHRDGVAQSAGPAKSTRRDGQGRIADLGARRRGCAGRVARYAGRSASAAVWSAGSRADAGCIGAFAGGRWRDGIRHAGRGPGVRLHPAGGGRGGGRAGWPRRAVEGRAAAIGAPRATRPARSTRAAIHK